MKLLEGKHDDTECTLYNTQADTCRKSILYK